MAAQQGNTEAIRELIECYDRLNLRRCWVWFYLAELLGTDRAKDEYRAINDDGSDYDDDIDGALYVDGRDAVDGRKTGTAQCGPLCCRATDCRHAVSSHQGESRRLAEADEPIAAKVRRLALAFAANLRGRFSYPSASS